MKGSGTLAWKRCPLRSFPFPPPTRRRMLTHINTRAPAPHPHSSKAGSPSETCHFSHSLRQPWDTMQTYLCVVHPIYQEDEQALQTQTKKERKGEWERTKLLQLFSLLSSRKKTKDQKYREKQCIQVCLIRTLLWICRVKVECGEK